MSLSRGLAVATFGACAVLGCESIVGIREIELHDDDAGSASKPVVAPDAASAAKRDAGDEDDWCILPENVIVTCPEGQTAGKLPGGTSCRGACECAQGLVCAFALGKTLGTCVVDRACGEPCTEDEQCRSNECFVKTCR